MEKMKSNKLWEEAKSVSQRVGAQKLLEEIASGLLKKGDGSVSIWETTPNYDLFMYSVILTFGFERVQWGDRKVPTTKGIRINSDAEGVVSVSITRGANWMTLYDCVQVREELTAEEEDKLEFLGQTDIKNIPLSEQVREGLLIATPLLGDLRQVFASPNGRFRKI